MKQSEINYLVALVEKIKYGSVTIVIHDGKITQLDVAEKHRLSK
ncbi:YezD family protein [Ectobacillus ponti]|uniref:YezD family protein n=1 Tax=Ectobacillus ponti TaxID=2961894 RepID=A0AA41X5H7_9BACI|nr:YezD family protein [Ectobacillus ponti]MCP8967220.1 YezD family protein [Ectobacillus ponti]